MRLFRDLDGMRLIGQDRDGQGIRQSKYRVGGSAIAAQVIQDDGQARFSVFLALVRSVPRSSAGRPWNDDMDRIRNRAGAAIIEPQQRSRTCPLVSRQMVRRGAAVQGLDEARYRFALGLFGGASRQYDK